MEPMPYYEDTRLSLMARGLLAYFAARGTTEIALADIQQAEAGGMGRDRAMRLAAELKACGLLRRTRGGFILSPQARVNAPPIHPGEYVEKSESQEILTFRKNRLLDYTHKTPDPDSGSGSDPGVVNSADEKSVFPVLSDFSHVLTQTSLIGLPELPSPVAPPPSPVAPKRPRPPPPPAEAQALYAPLFELTATPRQGKRAMGVYSRARALWAEFAAVPAQVAAFETWFKRFSPAAQTAARERRPVNAPMPRQVYELWPAFLPWWQATQDAAARAAVRPPAPALDLAPLPAGTGRALYEAYRRPARHAPPPGELQ